MARVSGELMGKLEHESKCWSGEGRCGGRVEEMLGLLVREENEELVPRAASDEAFPVRAVIVVVEAEGGGLDLIPGRDCARE